MMKALLGIGLIAVGAKLVVESLQDAAAEEPAGVEPAEEMDETGGE